MPSDRDYEIDGIPVRITNWGGWPYRSHIALQLTLELVENHSDVYRGVIEWFAKYGEEIHAVMTYEEYGSEESHPEELLELVVTSKFAGYHTRTAAQADLRALDQPTSESNPVIDSSGYVYLIASGGGLYKIGKSVNPESRLKALQSGNPSELTLVHSHACPDMHATEAALHKRFSETRINGTEWFHLDDRDVAAFPAMARAEARRG